MELFNGSINKYMSPGSLVTWQRKGLRFSLIVCYFPNCVLSFSKAEFKKQNRISNWISFIQGRSHNPPKHEMNEFCKYLNLIVSSVQERKGGGGVCLYHQTAFHFSQPEYWDNPFPNVAIMAYILMCTQAMQEENRKVIPYTSTDQYNSTEMMDMFCICIHYGSHWPNVAVGHFKYSQCN